MRKLLERQMIGRAAVFGVTMGSVALLGTSEAASARTQSSTLPAAVYSQRAGQVVAAPMVRPTSLQTLFSLVNFAGVGHGANGIPAAISWNTWGARSARATAIAGPISSSSNGARPNSYKVALSLAAPKTVHASFGTQRGARSVYLFTKLTISFSRKPPRGDTRTVTFKLVPYNGGPVKTVWWHLASGHWANDGTSYHYL